MDPTIVAAHYAPEGSLAINGGPPAVGREAISATARSFYTALPDMQVSLDYLVVEGDRIEYHWTFTGHEHRAGRDRERGAGQRLRGMDDRR